MRQQNSSGIPPEASIRIHPVSNGFVVRRESDMRDTTTSIEDSMVFQSFTELIMWLCGHFSHRDAGVKADTRSAA